MNDPSGDVAGILAREMGLFHGQGPQLYLDLVKNGDIVRKWTYDQEIWDWLKSWNYRRFIDMSTVEYKYLKGIFVKRFIRRGARIGRRYRFETNPGLFEMVFGNYKRLIYLAQTDNPDLRARAVGAADLLGLAYEERRTGYGELQPSLVQFVNMGAVGATLEQHGVAAKRVTRSDSTRGGATPEKQSA